MSLFTLIKTEVFLWQSWVWEAPVGEKVTSLQLSSSAVRVFKSIFFSQFLSASRHFPVPPTNCVYNIAHLLKKFIVCGTNHPSSSLPPLLEVPFLLKFGMYLEEFSC